MPKSLQEMLNESDGEKHRVWIIECTNEQLDEYILCMANGKLNAIAVAERTKRQLNRLSEPHWTITPGFVIGVLAMVFAAIAAWPVIREWLPAALPSNTSANSPPPQSNSAPVKLTTSQTSPPVIYVAPDTNLLK